MRTNSYFETALRRGAHGRLKRLLIVAVAVLVAFAMIPAAGLGGATDEAHAADPIVLTVSKQLTASGTAIKQKEYTEADLKALVDITEKTGYIGPGGDPNRMYKTQNAVSLEKILNDSLKTTEGFVKDSQYVTADTDSGKPGSATFTYADLTTDSKFYPATGPEEKSTTGAVSVKPALALTATLDNITSTAAGDLASWDGTLSSQKDMQFVRGISEEKYITQPSKFGMTFLTGVDSIIVIERADKTLAEVANDLDKEVSELDEKVAELDKKVDELDKEIEQSKGDKEKLEDEKAALEKDKAALEKEKAALEAQKAEQQKQLDAANQKVFKAVSAKISKVKAGKKKATVTWKKIGTAEGYKIVYSTSKKFKSKKTVTVKSVKTVKKAITKLKKGKTYYFKVRGYAKIGGKTVYTKYSAVKKVKIKK